jgi:hypothetical protein
MQRDVCKLNNSLFSEIFELKTHPCTPLERGKMVLKLLLSQ